MFIIATKINRKKVLLGLGLIGAFALGIFAAVPRLSGDDAQPTAGEVKVESKKLKTDEARRTYLEQFGWELADTEPEISQIQIPESFNSTYESYNELQKRQGFDLSKYAGKDMQLFRYQVTNHPSGEEGVTANLLLYKNKVVGGDVSSAQMDGFLHCLNENMPGQSSDAATQQDGANPPENGENTPQQPGADNGEQSTPGNAQQPDAGSEQQPQDGEKQLKDGDGQQQSNNNSASGTSAQAEEETLNVQGGIYYLDTEE